MQGYISRLPIEDFALVSDSGYVAQNGGRIIRALQEIAISRKWGQVSSVLISMSKAVEKRMWPFDQPLKQFQLKADVLYNLERWGDELGPPDLCFMSADDIGKRLHLNEIHGAAVLHAAQQFPALSVEYSLRPLGHDILKVSLIVHKAFSWNTRIHGSAELFWLWVESHEDATILQQTQLMFHQNTETVDVDFVISIPQGAAPDFFTVRYTSDRWIGAEDEIVVSLSDLLMPPQPRDHTSVHDLPFLSISTCRTPRLKDLVGSQVTNLNTIQTQVFWSLMETRLNTLVCAPTGSGKTTMAQMLAL
jgi:antiviral helicase SLH1